MMQCSSTCGGGIKTRTLDCARAVDVEEDEYSVVPDEFCKNAVKPPVTELCNEDILCEGNEYSEFMVDYSGWSVFLTHSLFHR